MAFILTPVSSLPYRTSTGFCSPAIRPAYRQPRMCLPPRRPQYSSFNHFFDQVDELLGQINHQAQHQAQLDAQRKIHNQRQLRKRALRAQFAVSQNEPGWQVDGDIQGFEQENLSIEVTNEYTLKIAGNTEWQLGKNAPQNDAVSTIEQEAEGAQGHGTNSTTVAETEIVHTVTDSDTESHKSYQATVEDDFEDLGAETSSLISAHSESSTISETVEPKGKGNVEEEHNATENQTTSSTQKEDPHNQERQHGSFERTFKFPERIDAANVRASFKDGTLSIAVPRAPTQSPKTITIL